MIEDIRIDNVDITDISIPQWVTEPPRIMNPVVPPVTCLLYTSPSPRDVEESRMPSSA